MIYYALSVATNVLCTVLIIFRILRVTGFSGLNTYRGVIEILVESAALYSAMYIVYIIIETNAFYDTHLNESELFPGAMIGAVTVSNPFAPVQNHTKSETENQGIAPTLIIARVAAGHARPDHTWRHSSPMSTKSVSHTVASVLRFRTTHSISAAQTRDVDLDAAEIASTSSRSGTDVANELQKNEAMAV